MQALMKLQGLRSNRSATVTRAVGQHTGVDEKNAAGNVLQGATTRGVGMGTESQEEASALDSEDPSEGRLADAGASIEAEHHESQETVLMDDSQEEILDLASEAPS